MGDAESSGASEFSRGVYLEIRDIQLVRKPMGAPFARAKAKM